MITLQSNYKPVYCHFSFRRPKGSSVGIFAACIFADEAGRVSVARKVREFPLWLNQQHVTAIQAYEHALLSIWEWQGKLLSHGVTDVILVTDNSILAGWIEEPKKNKEYIQWMQRAVSSYRTGGAKEIMLNIALAEPRASEKSYKYCRPELVENHRSNKAVRKFRMDTADLSGIGLVTDLARLAEGFDDNGVRSVPVTGLAEDQQ